MSNPFESEPVRDHRDDHAVLILRLGAKLLDSAILAAPWVPMVLVLGFASTAPGGLPDDPPPLFMGVAFLGLMVALGIAIYQWVQIANTGQTIGKRAFGVRIVKLDGSPVDFVSGVVLRIWVPGAVTGVANQCCLGWVVQLADIAPIFGEERRCVHDHIAGTKVVRAERD